jgi:ABC-type glycerol-3-phosphate transport system permease component
MSDVAAAPNPRHTRSRRARARLPRLLVVYPCLILVAAVVLYPVVWMIYSAFKPDGAILASVFSLPRSLYLSNFTHVFNSGMDTWVYNSLFVTVTSVAGTLAMASAAAYAFSMISFRGRDVLYAFMLVGLMVPPQAIVIAGFRWMTILHFVDTYWALIFTYFGWSSFGILVLRNFFNSVPTEIKDAARIDGAGHWQMFTRILLPLARPSLATIAIFNFMWVWNEFIYPLVYSQSETHYTIPIGILLFQSRSSIEYGTQMAGLVVATAIPLVVYLLFRRQFVRGIFEGALKG